MNKRMDRKRIRVGKLRELEKEEREYWSQATFRERRIAYKTLYESEQ